MLRASAILLCAVGLCACTVTREISLYPTGNSTSSLGVLRGELAGHGEGHGTINIVSPDGELLDGEYSIVFDSSVAFGSIFGSVYGPTGVASGSAASSSFSMSGEGEGQASIFGNRGTTMQCEFLNQNMTGHGYGACRTPKGVTYRMIY